MNNNNSVLILIAIGVLLAVLFVVPLYEGFGSVQAYQHPSVAAAAAAGGSGNGAAGGSTIGSEGSSVDCSLFPASPACQPTPDPGPVQATLKTCTPAGGQWSIPGAGPQGRSALNSPCCQPPPPNAPISEGYKLAETYKTCDDDLDTTDPIEQCVANCCAFADNEANNYDTSWYPMARCACSLWCYNQKIPHFSKYGTAVHYISGDIAEAETADTGGFIGGGGDFSGGAGSVTA